MRQTQGVESGGVPGRRPRDDAGEKQSCSVATWRGGCPGMYVTFHSMSSPTQLRRIRISCSAAASAAPRSRMQKHRPW